MCWPGRLRPISSRCSGADVIKVEHPDDPDQSRGGGTDKALNRKNMGTAFLTQASNKRSIALDLKQEEDREILKKLVATADVFVENYRPGAFEALGLGYEELSKINPRLIYASFSAFGQKGPRGGSDRLRPRHPGDLRHHGDDRHQGHASGEARLAGGRLFDRHDRRVRACRPRCSSASAPAKASASIWRCWTWR